LSARPSAERILLVDDERTIVDAGTIGLTRAGYLVRATTVANEAINIAMREPFDLLICDIVMSGISGIDVLRTIKHIYPEIAAVMITGYGSTQSAIDALQAGADGFLLKPFGTAQLRQAVGDALAKSRTLKESLRLKALMPLYESSKAFHAETRLDRLGAVVVEHVAKSVGGQSVTLLLPEGDAGQLNFKVAESFPIGANDLDAETEAIGWVARSGSSLNLGELPATIPAGLSSALGATLYVPLQASGSLVGILRVQKTSVDQPFSDGETEMIAIQASQAAIAIKNALLMNEIEQGYLSALTALANALDARDPGTLGHADRVSRNAVLIAEVMGLPSDAIDQVRVGALLHDIGKVGIPDSILQKPGRLTEEEYTLVKQHTLIGDRILAPVAPLQKIRPIVLNHHERYDGAGYPHGLAGDEIPLAARVVAVVDAFDAIMESRAHAGQSIAQAIHELREGRATQFDPEVVDAFLEVLEGVPGAHIAR
jgi:putative nucleotidyltransferase with HDIG domain